MKHRRFIALILFLLIANAGLMAGATFGGARKAASREANRELVRTLGLTDLALWTEARYSRHPSQTDFFSPFQDLPGGMEHFPAGSLIAVPSHLVSGEVDDDHGQAEAR